MDMKSIFCLILPTLATLHISLAEEASLVDEAKSPISADSQGSIDGAGLSEADKRRWANFHTWGKRWGNLPTWGKRWASSEFPVWGKKWSDSSFASWGKRDSATPEEQKRNWNQFITWGKRNWHALSAWGKRSQGAQQDPEKKWNNLPTWGKRAGGWDTGFTAWGKRADGDVRDKLMKLFDASNDGVLDSKELGNFLSWLGSVNDVAMHP